jgi:aspartate/methionine/tyrosine aminotransferase
VKILKEASKNLEKIRVHMPKAGAIFLMEFIDRSDDEEICEELFREYGILICPGSTFDLKGFTRVGMGAKPELFKERLEILKQSITNILSKEKG